MIKCFSIHPAVDRNKSYSFGTASYQLIIDTGDIRSGIYDPPKVMYKPLDSQKVTIWKLFEARSLFPFWPVTWRREIAMWRPCVGLALCNLTRDQTFLTPGVFWGPGIFETYPPPKVWRLSKTIKHRTWKKSAKRLLCDPLRSHLFRCEVSLCTKVFVGRKSSWSVCSWSTRWWKRFTGVSGLIFWLLRYVDIIILPESMCCVWQNMFDTPKIHACTSWDGFKPLVN